MKKLCAFMALSGVFMASVCCASEHFATTNMTWPEFYSGETGETSAELSAQGLDAITTPTTKALGRFPLLDGTTDDNGTTLTGMKAVPVRMNDEVFAMLSKDARYTFTDETFSEYKDVNPDGSFAKMVSEITEASGAEVTLLTGEDAKWGNYVLKIKGAKIDIGRRDDKIARNFLGALLETSDGKIYAMRHDNNIWSTADDMAFCVNENYTEPHGKGIMRQWKYTASLEGKTITKITFLLNGLPDVVINCNISVKNSAE